MNYLIQIIEPQPPKPPLPPEAGSDLWVADRWVQVSPYGIGTELCKGTVKNIFIGVCRANLPWGFDVKKVNPNLDYRLQTDELFCWIVEIV